MHLSLCYPLMLHFDALFATGMPLKPAAPHACTFASPWQEERTSQKERERKREGREAAAAAASFSHWHCADAFKKHKKHPIVPISLREQKKKAFNTYPFPDTRLSVHLSSVCVSTETSDIPPKQMCKEEQWGSPSFVCEPAWLGFSICISRLFTALKQVDDKNINLSRHIVWHAHFDTLPSLALYSIITHSYSLLAAQWMNMGSNGSWRTSVHCWSVLLL